MARTKRPHYINFGPSIPVVSHKDFSELAFTPDQWAALWEVCGPTVERNLLRDAPMWHIIATAYMEGLLHGYGIAMDQQPKEPKQLELKL